MQRLKANKIVTNAFIHRFEVGKGCANAEGDGENMAVATWLIALDLDMFICVADHNEEIVPKLTWILESG